MSVHHVHTGAGWSFDTSYARLPSVFYREVNPTPVREPKLVKLNATLAEQLGLSVPVLQSGEGTAVMAGNRIPEGSTPIAQAYAGHQFGYFTMLGDGRAILLGEHLTPGGERYDIQLKGPGITPYSRRGDGRAALGPMLREYIISEAMFALGIPTTRSLAVVTTGEPVYRESILPGAILTRVAASHIRVGTFQYIAKWGTKDDLRIFADYTINRHYADILNHPGAGEERYLHLLRSVIRRQAELIAKWMLVGFVHGVMNTDNMSICGETIDYGPCAFMDAYDPATVFSSIDTQGRYAYGNQPAIAAWNLARFAETLLPLLHAEEEKAIVLAEEAVSEFGEHYQRHWLTGMRGKLGIGNEEPEDESLIEELLSLMHRTGSDYTNTFRDLTTGKVLETPLAHEAEFAAWQERWHSRLARQALTPEQSRQLMKANNPAVIPRNHRVEEALEAASEQGDYSVLERLLEVLASPYEYDNNKDGSDYCSLPASGGRPYRTYCGT